MGRRRSRDPLARALGARHAAGAGGRFFSVRDGLDTGTDTGRMVLRILLSKAEWDLERIREAWDVSHERAVARGIYPMAYTPVGYTRTSVGRLRRHPRVGPIVTELYTLRAAGHSIHSLCGWLDGVGVARRRAPMIPVSASPPRG